MVLPTHIPMHVDFQRLNSVTSIQLNLIEELDVADERRRLFEKLRFAVEDLLHQCLFVAWPRHIIAPRIVHADELNINMTINATNDRLHMWHPLFNGFLD